MWGVRRTPHHHDGLVPVEHSVTGRTVAHTPAQILLLAGIFGLADDPRGQDQGPAVVHLAAHRDHKPLPSHEGDGFSGQKLGPQLLGVALEFLQHLMPSPTGQAQVVIYLLRPGQGAVLPPIANDQHALAPAPGPNSGSQPRRAAAQYDDIIGHGATFFLYILYYIHFFVLANRKNYPFLPCLTVQIICVMVPIGQ